MSQVLSRVPRRFVRHMLGLEASFKSLQAIWMYRHLEFKVKLICCVGLCVKFYSIEPSATFVDYDVEGLCVGDC